MENQICNSQLFFFHYITGEGRGNKLTRKSRRRNDSISINPGPRDLLDMNLALIGIF